MATKTITTLPVVDAIEAAISDRNISIRAAAKELGVSPNTLTYWIRGATTPPLDGRLQAALARFLGVSPRRVVELFGINLDDVASGEKGGSHRSSTGTYPSLSTGLTRQASERHAPRQRADRTSRAA